MPLTEGQVQLRTLVMGDGTDYRIQSGFNPWSRHARADQGAGRAWADGSWSGAEFQAEAIVPIRILVVAPAGTAAWLAAHQALLAAFAPSHTDLELRFVIGGAEYVMYGRPRMVEPETDLIGLGMAYTQAAFVALDPMIYSGAEHVESVGLPMTSGGLTLPVTLPFTIGATVAGGSLTLANAGTAPTGLLLRIDGPVAEPRVSLQTDAGTETLWLDLTLDTGQWLDIDTQARTVYLNGTASRRGQAYGDWPLLPTSGGELSWTAAAYEAAALLTVTWHDSWY
jgi:hypothetical protein